MKKQLLIAAVAATMSAGVFADISIKGDAHLRYANQDGNANISNDGNYAGQRVRLHVTGKSGDTVIKFGLRHDGGTRVANGVRQSDGGGATGSGAGLQGGNLAAFNVDYQYLTTKIGALNIKIGDWWDTTGLGAARKGKADADRIEFSTKVAGWKLGLETGAGSISTVLSANGKIGNFNVTFEHNAAVSVDGPALVPGTGTAVTDGTNGFDAVHEGNYTDVSIKGKIGAVGVAAEYFAGTNDTYPDAGATAALVHVWTKLRNITWHFAYAQTDDGIAGIVGKSNKFSPLGISILGVAPGVNGKLAFKSFGNSNDTFTGIRADAKVAGMGVQVALGTLSLDDGGVDIADGAFWDIIVTRPLGKGSNIKFSAGNYDEVTSAGAKISVKF